MTTPLRLSPLPSVRSEDPSGTFLMEQEGFVDEAVVAALRITPEFTRSEAHPADLALAADDMDFAGWRVAPAPPARSPEVAPQVIEAIMRHTVTPLPRIAEPGFGPPHEGNHRWWLAALTGVFSTLLIFVLLLTLAARPGSGFETILPPGILTSAKPAPSPVPEAPKIEPELTEASADRR